MWSSNYKIARFNIYGVIFSCLLVLIVIPIKLEAKSTSFIIHQDTYLDSLIDLSSSLYVNSQSESSELLDSTSKWPLYFEKDEKISLSGKVINTTSEHLYLAIYFSVDKVNLSFRSSQGHSYDTIISGAKSYLSEVIRTKSKYLSSHLARESALFLIQAYDTLEIEIKCGPYWQNKNIDRFQISSEAYYFSQFSSVRDNQLTQFWNLQGMFLFMVAFSFFMYLINRDRAYLYFSLYALAFTEYLILTVPTDSFFCFGNHPKFQGIIFNIAAYAMPGMYGLFTLTYVHSDNYEPKLRRVIVWALWGTLFCCIASTLYLLATKPSATWYTVMFWVYKMVSSSFGVMGIYALYVYLTSDSKLVRYFGFASLFIVGTGLLVLGGNYLFGSFGNTSNAADIRLVLTFQFGAMLQLLGFALCLSYRGRLIEQAKNRIENISEAKSRFFANVSHEFRTPLTLILGPTNELLEKQHSPEDQKQLTLIQRNGHRLLRFINQILDLAKLEEGQIGLKKVPGDMIAFVKRVTGSFESIATDKQIDLQFHSQENFLACSFDPDKLEKVLNNLIFNACKFTPIGGNIAVDVSIKQTESILIRVIDDGPGISLAHQPYIFDRFFQAPSKDFTTNQPSTGIGLAITKELVELHGGTIHLESQIGQGSTFHVTIPYVPVPKEAIEKLVPNLSNSYPIIPPTQETAISPQTKTASTVGLPLLLIVEDNADVTKYLRSILTDQYQLSEATDGISGLKTALTIIPDLIISDVMMPLKDGFQLTADLKSDEKTSHIPVIILTGKYSKSSKIKGLEVEADAYLTKPFESNELLATIKSLLNNRRRLQDKYRKLIQVEPLFEEVSASIDDIFIQKCLRAVEENYQNENFSIVDFADALEMTRGQLHKKLKALTGLSPSLFLRSIRLKHAARLLIDDSSTISEIAFRVGFSSTTYFNKVFKKEYGKTPSEFRNSET